MTTPISLAAYAKRRGVSHVAVGKAVASGRLSASVVRDARGAPKIGNPDLADQEWSSNTRPRIDHPAEPTSTEPADDPLAVPPAVSPGRPPTASTAPDYHESRARREAAAARREAALADMAELDAAERKGELVSVEEARADVVGRFTIVRTKILGIAARVAQRLPHLAGEVVPVLDELLREALEELAVSDDESLEGES